MAISKLWPLKNHGPELLTSIIRTCLLPSVGVLISE
jgi:hypothetical protein